MAATEKDRRPRGSARLARAVVGLREWLSRTGRGVWRHRRTGLAVAWTVAVIGWTAVLLEIPVAARSASPSDARALAEQVEGSRRFAELPADLAAAHAPSEAGGDGPAAALADVDRQPLRPDEPERTPRLGLLCAVLAIALAAAAGGAFWRAQRDGIVDHPSQLRHRAGLPLLGTIAVPSSLGQQRRRRLSGLWTGLASLALLALFGAVVAADAHDPGALRGLLPD